MSLYPIITIDAAAAADGPNALASGTLAVIPIDMTVHAMVQLAIAQASLTQDFSLRGWISALPDGASLTPYPGVFPVSRVAGMPIVVYGVLQTPPSPCIAVPIMRPDIYYLNLLNLTNEPNQFLFALTVLA